MLAAEMDSISDRSNSNNVSSYYCLKLQKKIQLQGTFITSLTELQDSYVLSAL